MFITYMYILWVSLAALGLASDLGTKRQLLNSCSHPNEPFCCTRIKVTVYADEDDTVGHEVYDDKCTVNRRIGCSARRDIADYFAQVHQLWRQL